jgi:hypothetical protein
MTVYLQPQCCKVVVAPFLLALSGAEPFVCVCVFWKFQVGPCQVFALKRITIGHFFAVKSVTHENNIIFHSKKLYASIESNSKDARGRSVEAYPRPPRAREGERRVGSKAPAAGPKGHIWRRAWCRRLGRTREGRLNGPFTRPAHSFTLRHTGFGG